MEIIETAFNALTTSGASSNALSIPSSTNLGTNPLASISSKLFSILSQLKKSLCAYEPEALHQYLTHEIKKFATDAAQLGYKEEQILLSEYLFCHAFDHTLAHTAWGRQNNWSGWSLVRKLPHAENMEHNIEFAIKKMCQLPHVFIDLLELAYLCLSLSNPARSKEPELYWQNHEMLTVLYQTIHLQRGEFEKRLSKPTFEHPFRANQKRKSWKFARPLFILVPVVIIMGLYIGFNYLSTQAGQTVTNELSTLTQTQHQHGK